MSWHATLALDYRLHAQTTVAHHLHHGPLRILQSLYPQGPAICHNVLVHPPGGLVGGDTLDIRVSADTGTHGLMTTPGATRFYRSDGATAVQRTHLTLRTGSRLEWLPLETICYSGCLAENRVQLHLEPGAEMLGWDVTALGLPHAHQAFVAGRLQQHLEMPGIWLERACLDAKDTRLLNSPAGMAGQRCVALAFFVAGSPLERGRRQRALDSSRAAIAQHPLAATAGITSPHPQVILARCLSDMVEPTMNLLRTVRSVWREELWGLEPSTPRIWSM